MTKNELIEKYNFNEAQASVVLDNSKELIVPAGAGSGKTKTLVGKVIHLLKQGHELESFLVLTFTKKAAGEMKQRIKKELKAENLDHLINKIDSSNIQTFDGFAYNFVKQNASLAGLDSSLELLDSAILNHVKLTFVKELVYDIIKDSNSKYYQLIETYTRKTSLDEFLNDFIKLYESLVSEKPLKKYTYEELLKTNLIDLDIKEVIREISEEYYQDNMERVDTFNSYLFSLVNNKEFEFVKIANNKWNDLDKELRKKINKVLDPLNSLYKLKATNDNFQKLILEQIESSKLILELLNEYENKLDEFKKTSNKYEFRDIANFLNEILRDNEVVLKRIKSSLKFVFVDEYQDTSLVQSEFLEMLILDNDNINVLYVGDLKQSIYKFRDAKPETFIEKLNTVNVIPLEINYRSSSHIIDFVNKIFTNILTDEETYDINYKKGHYMESGSKAFENDLNAEVYLLEQFSEDGKASVLEEAFIVGNKIKELINKGVSNSYKDFAILMRNKGNFKIFQDVFEYLNIPLQVQTAFDVKQAYLLKLIANILSLALNLNKENMNRFKFDYFSILRSELFEISDFELYEEYTNNNFNYISEDNSFYQKLNLINQAILTKSNKEIINLVISEFNIYESIIKAPKAFEKTLQIDYLLNISKPLSDIGVYGIQFINYIEDISYNDNLRLFVDVLDDEDENSVVLTNIHQSKGLEYPILFLVDLTKKFGTTNTKEFSYNKDFGLVFKSTGDEISKLLSKLQRDRAKEIELKDTLKEEMRLLYTAITRAERALYIVGVDHDTHEELSSFNDYLYHFGLRGMIKLENIETFNESIANSEYFLKLRDSNKYYPKEIDLLDKVILEDRSNLKEETVASININSIIDDNTKLNLMKGTKLHEKLEFGNLFNELKKHNFNNKDFSKGSYIKELPFYFEEEDKINEGIIDLVVDYSDEVHIIDYKTYDIDPSKYENQLNAYHKYISLIYPNKTIKKYMYSIVLDKVIEVK